MTDTDEPRAWEYREHSLIVLPGVSWEEWTTLWTTVEQTHKSSSFWCGDALLAGRANFGEQFSQVVDPKYIHQQQGPMWVCSKIEPSRRRPSLSYSMHREIAGLKSREEQDRWLDLAEAERWTVRQLKEAMAAKARGNGGPPLDGSDDAEPDSTWNEPAAIEPEANTFGDVEEVTGEPLRCPLAQEEAPPPPDASPEPVSAPTANETPTAARLRGCIEELRALAPKLRRTHVDRIVQIEDQITDALGWETGRVSLLNTEIVLRLLPKGWQYSLTLTKGGEQIAVGLGPSLACAVVEAILAARLSDLGEG